MEDITTLPADIQVALDQAQVAADGNVLAVAVMFLVGMAAVLAIVGFVMWVIMAIARWKLFTKAGEPGWKSLIPFYGQYTQFKLTWDVKYFWIILCCEVAVGIFNAPFMTSDSSSLAAIGAGLVGIIMGIASIVIDVISCHKLSKSFGHDIGFTLGLVFLNSIFILILGFGKSQYIGNTTKDAQINEAYMAIVRKAVTQK